METHDLLDELSTLIQQAELVKSIMITQNNNEIDHMTSLLYELYWMYNRLSMYV